MGERRNIHRLSGNGATGELIALDTYPTLTEVHVIPDGETHLIHLWVNNAEVGADRSLLGNFGDAADQLRCLIPAETSKKIAEAVLIGPTSVDLGMIAGSALRVFGYVEVFKYTS